MNRNKYIFMSYSKQDASIAEEIAVEIEKEVNTQVWLDHKQLLPGDMWEKEIQAALTNAAVVLTLISPRYLESEWFVTQTNLAISLKIPLIPIMIETVRISDLPLTIRQIQIVKYPEQKTELFKAIIILLEKEQKKSAKPKTITRKQTTKADTKKQVDTSSSVNQQYQQTSTPYPIEDKTPFHKDSPSSIDYLGRQGFVEALAQWIDRYWEEYKSADKSFIINLHGQWGAGKTTFLKLLEYELKKPSANQWTVVWFNAWENRHIKPEWWPLLDRIYRDALSQKKANKEWVWHIKFQEWWWRFFSGRKWELLGFVASSALLIFIYYWVMRTGFFPDKDVMTRVEGVAKSIGLVFSAVSTIFLGARFISQTFINSGSANAAQVYLQFTPDPIEGIKKHFDKLIEEKINKPVIVFIDDLDRCDRNYLVNLLESTQTLLNHRKVFYVIAADQRWLFAAFEETYKEFKDSIKEPGKKIGYLFLEKIFQLSMSIPNISNEARVVYLDYLLGKKEQVEERREQIKKDMAGIVTEQALISKVQSQTAGTIDKVIMREVAVSKSASLEIEKATTHFLSDFAHLMESNPRAIKRLVTFYGVQRAIAILSDEEIVSDLTKRNQLALWTIVKMRWPLLADYLEEYPQYLENFKKGKTSKAIHADLIDLIKDQEVMDVLKGKGINAELDADSLRRFTSLKATERTF